MSQILKTGNINSGSFSEAFLNIFDTTIYDEPDGSAWIKLVHHNTPATKLFSSSGDFTKPYYIDEDRWFNGALCNLITNDTYEFMVRSKAETTSTEYKYRWVQPINPMVAVYEDVAANLITRVTTTGYTNFSWGGIYAHKAQTYFCANNGTKGNWWGAIGTWQLHQEGITGWTTIIKSGYQDLYLRVDNQANTLASIFDTHIQAPDFIEI